MRLINDQGVVLIEIRVRLNFGQQDTVSHELDACIGRQLVVETHLEADNVTKLGLQLRGNPLGDATRGQPARLRMAYGTGNTSPQLQTEFRNLRGLPRAGLTTHDHHLMRFNRAQDVLAALHHRQSVRIEGLGLFSTTRFAARDRGVYVRFE